MVLNWLLFDRHPIYMAGVFAQAAFAILALGAWLGPKVVSGFAPGRYCFYFALLNWASAVALFRFLRGQKQVLWQPRVG